MFKSHRCLKDVALLNLISETLKIALKLTCCMTGIFLAVLSS